MTVPADLDVVVQLNPVTVNFVASLKRYNNAHVSNGCSTDVQLGGRKNDQKFAEPKGIKTVLISATVCKLALSSS